MEKAFYIIMIFFCLSNLSFSQGEFVIQNKKESDKIRFKLIHNLIIIPVEINGVELSFILDTGVSKPIIFNFLNITDTLSIKDTEKIFLRGLGEGEPIEALKSKNNIIKVGDAINLNQDLYAIFDSKLNFAPKLGVPIHGIIGYDLFKDFVVEINYSSKYIKLTNYKRYTYKNCNKCESLNLEFYNNKPYLYANVKIRNKVSPVKLLIDTGGSDALWLFEDKDLGLTSNEYYFNDFLGHGLSGSVYGKRSKVEEFSIKSFKLKNANVAFPDSTSIILAKQFKGRNGSLAGNILKRFNMIVDYRRARITLKKSKYFKNIFNYNKSGIELEHNGTRIVKERAEGKVANLVSDKNLNGVSNSKVVLNTNYKFSIKPAYTIVELRQGSPAHKAGLMIGDIIISINNKESHNFSLQEVVHMFFDEEGKRIKLKIDRNGQFLIFKFKLESLFKKKP